MKRLATLLTVALSASAAAQTTLPADTARVHYQRTDGAYAGWGLHVWEDTTAQVAWDKPLTPTGTNSFGVYWDVPMKTDWKKLGFIVHNGDNKDPGADQVLTSEMGNQAWIVSGSATVNTTRPDTGVRTVGDLTRQQAVMLSRDLIAVKPEFVQPGALLTLHAARAGGLKLTAAVFGVSLNRDRSEQGRLLGQGVDAAGLVDAGLSHDRIHPVSPPFGIGSRPEQGSERVRGRGRIEPEHRRLRVETGGHPVVDRSHDVIGSRRHDREGVQGDRLPRGMP